MKTIVLKAISRDLTAIIALSEAAFEADSLAAFEKTLTTFSPPD